MKRCMVWTAILGLLLVCSTEGWARTWKSKTGKFSVDAELVEVEDGKAVLKRTDGKIVRVPIEKLSAADRRYLESLNKPAANSATPPNKEQPPKDAASDITAPVAPADDANPPAWTMNLSKMKIPDGRVFGKLHGQRFVPDQFTLRGGTLTFQEGKDVFAPRRIRISLLLKEGEDIRARSFRFLPSDKFGQPFVNITYEKNGTTFGKTETYMNKYAMVLSFGKSRNGQLPGKIYLCAPDEAKSVAAGSFLVEVFDETHPETTKSRISGRVTVKGTSQGIDLSVGCYGKNREGKLEGPGGSFKLGGGISSMTSTTWAPRFSSLSWDKDAGVGSHEHLNRPAGHYLVYAQGNFTTAKSGHQRIAPTITREGYYDWKWVHLKTDDTQVRVDLAVDRGNTGSVEITVQKSADRDSITYLPLDEQGELPLPELLLYIRGTTVKELESGKTVVHGLRPGKYRFATIRRGAIVGTSDAEVKRGEKSNVEMVATAPTPKKRPTTRQPTNRQTKPEQSSADGNGNPKRATAARQQNLAATATYSASSQWSTAAQFAPDRAFDDRFNTRWNSTVTEGVGAWLAARWTQPVTVRKVFIYEAFDRIAGFKIQQFDAKRNDWIDVVLFEGAKFAKIKGNGSAKDPNDGSVNPVFRIDLPKPVTTTAIRLLITKATSPSITIFEMQAY